MRIVVRSIQLISLGMCLGYFLTAPVLASETTWLSQSSDWFDPANWSDGVPDASTDALIGPGGLNFPVISNGVASVRNLRIVSRQFNIGQGGRLEAADILVEFGGSAFRMLGPDAEVWVSGDMRFGGTVDGPNASDSIPFSVFDGALLRVDGDLELGDPDYFNPDRTRVVNLNIRGEDSLVDVGGDLAMAVQANSIPGWREGTVRVAGAVTVGAGENSSERQFVLRIGGQFDTLAAAPQIDLTSDDPAIVLLRTMDVNRLEFLVDGPGYRLESAAGVPISLRGGFDVFDRSPGHTVADGDHEVSVWRIEQGTAEFNGSVDGKVELWQGRTLTASAAIGHLHSAGIVQIRSMDEPGALTISDEFVQTSSGSIRFRVTASGADQLTSAGALRFEGGDIQIQIDEDAEPGTYLIMESTLGIAPFNAPVEILNQGSLEAETVVTATGVRLELRRVGELDLDTTALEFGPVALGEFAEQTVMLGNIGGGALEISFQPPAEPSFSLAGGSCPLQFAFSLAPDQSCDVVIRFEPDRAGEISSSLTIAMPGEGNSESVSLSGLGIAGPDIFSDRFESQR